EMVSNSRRGTNVRYAGLIDALKEASKRGKGIVVDAGKYWPGAKSHDIYISIYRIGKHYGLHVGQDRSKLDQGIVILWVKAEKEKA
ncbi:MAG TPA: hypothetical protein VGW37_07860, partial [Terriglobia bacterium]|nr:hypothetical protein [Terriglobia bacterium]